MTFLGTSPWVPIVAPLLDEYPIPEDTHSRVSESMGLPLDKWDSLRRRPQLCLPHVPLCIQYGSWLATQDHDMHIHMMNVIEYNATYANLADCEKQHTAEAQIECIRFNGQPLANWIWEYYVDQH